MSKNSKSAADMSELLISFATGLEQHVDEHPRLRGLINQINAKAESLTKPPKKTDPVVLTRQDGEILIEETPYLFRKVFKAWRFKLAELKGEVIGKYKDGNPMYELTYDKELECNVLPENKMDDLIALCKSFFPGSEIVLNED